MNWVRFRRLIYFPLLAVLIAIAITALGRGWISQAQALAIAAALLLVSFLGRMLLADLMRSRAAHARGDYEGALKAARSFLQALKARPWIAHGMWTQFGVYTLSAEAMAHNNAGAALIELQRLEEAEDALRVARLIDASYPLPSFNLALVARLRGDAASADEFAREAASLGFADGALDQTLTALMGAYARFTAR